MRAADRQRRARRASRSRWRAASSSRARSKSSTSAGASSRVRKRPPSAEQLHALRIRAKRARYALEFLGDLTGKSGKRLVKRLVELQDLLGGHQDAVVAAERIAATWSAVRRPHRARGSNRVLTELIAQHGATAARARGEFEAVWKRWSRCEQQELSGVLRKLARTPRGGAAAEAGTAPEAAP